MPSARHAARVAENRLEIERDDAHALLEQDACRELAVEPAAHERKRRHRASLLVEPSLVEPLRWPFALSCRLLSHRWSTRGPVERAPHRAVRACPEGAV